MNRKALVSTLAVTIALMFVGATGVMATDVPVICGEPQTYTLWGGKTIDVGTVTVSNDEENLYVTYATTTPWFLEEVQLYVLNTEPTDRLPPGQAPYKSGDITGATTYTFVVPLEGFGVTCDETVLWLQAHASVVKIVNDEIVQGETAYGGDITVPDQGSWYGNIMYVVQCCRDEVCYEFKGETAWAAGSRYVSKGNWATYTSYHPDNTVDLFAGQTMDAGDVFFSSKNSETGMVTIIISLHEGWEFENIEENVKIQNYSGVPPAKNPAPGLFTYKYYASGNFFSATVPSAQYYGVHVNVGQWVEVECPVPVEE